jgi:hypothetical protein
VVKVYTASDPLMAHLLRSALEAAGVEAQVRGEYLWSARGATPVTTDTLPAVWIVSDDDLDAAAAIVQDFERRTINGPIATWTCASCGELNEEQFTVCWNCGTSR